MSATDAQSRSAATDVVALLKQSDFSQVVEKARAMKLSIREEAKAMEHPVEDGSTITDHRVILPIEAELSVIVSDADYRSVYQSLKALFVSSELLILQTQTASYQSMIISGMPHEETPDMSGAIAITIRLKEVKMVKASYGTLPPRAVARPADSDTVKRGNVSTSPASDEQTKQGKTTLNAMFGRKK